MENFKCDTIEERLDDFITNIYAQNNHELKRLADAVERIDSTFIRHMQSTEDYKAEREKDEQEFKKEIHDKLLRLQEQLQPIADIKTAMRLNIKFMFGIAGLISALVGAYFMVKKLFM